MQHKLKKRLILATAVLSGLVLVGAFAYRVFKEPDSLKLATEGMPSLGSPTAKVEAVVFEDFLCYGCRVFNEEIFPQLESRYIASQKVRYTFVPLAFIEGSKPIANAALAVYKIAPDRFFAYARELFHLSDRLSKAKTPRPLLLGAAKKVGKIDLEQLKKCIDTKRYYEELDRHYQSAKKLMGKNFGTPALFVNGAATPTANFRVIENRIEHSLAPSAP